MYFHIITSFFNEREPFLKTWIHFVFVQEKMGENGVCASIHPILNTFDTAYAENQQNV